MIQVLFFVFVLFSGRELLARENNLALSYLASRSDCDRIQSKLLICGSSAQRSEILNLIRKTKTYPIGTEIFQNIEDSGKNLLIGHSEGAVAAAGKTLAPLTSALSDGRGASAVILFNFEIPITGSHRVGGTEQEWTEFTKIQNFFHELVHARNYMTGTTAVRLLEEQVIETENIFRTQSNPTNTNLRSFEYEKGEQIWFPNSR